MMLYVKPEPSESSASVDCTSVTDVWFSAASTAAVAPPPFEVIEGAVLTPCTLTVMVCESVPPSESVTVTSTT